MKKTYFDSNDVPSGGKEPFWKPWGAGWFLRLLGFLVLLFALILLLNLFKSTKADSDYDDEERAELLEPIIHPVSPDPVRVPVDSMASVPHDIENPSVNLPTPDDNILPPHTDDDITNDDGQQIVGDRLNVILNSTANDDTFNKWADEFKSLYPSDDYKVVYYDKLTKLLQIQVPQDERNQIMEALPQQITDIQFIVFHEGLIQFGSYKPNDPAFQHQELCWHFKPIQAYEAWDITKGSPDVVVAIVDSYFDLNHDELNSDRIVSPYSIPRHSGSVAPQSGCDEVSFMHGTFVASTALGNMDNERGTSGIAPLCKFMPVSLGHEVTSITVMQGLLYAIYQGASVVNLSLGFISDDTFSGMSLDEQVELSHTLGKVDEKVWDFVADLANERNVTIVWAAGNENTYLAIDPSKRGDRTIKVSAVDTGLKQADFSNFGNIPNQNIYESTISAPGVDITGAMPWNTYEVSQGTSFSAPIVTGAVALMKSIDPTLTTAEIAEILKETGKPIDGDTSIGNLLQIKDALLKVKGNFARFDDIMRDHTKLIGLWESTIMNDITVDGQPTGKKCRNYFDITSTERGTSITYAADTKKDYTADITIEWKTNEIVMHQPSSATHPTDQTYTFMPATFVCKPDAEGLLECEYTSSAGHKERYNLRKVRQRQDQERN
ncbi:MAG: S8 family serine peptidase [Prevotella sp.]|nr:S8 family serine peptidase [Prevotella sp.]